MDAKNVSEWDRDTQKLVSILCVAALPILVIIGFVLFSMQQMMMLSVMCLFVGSGVCLGLLSMQVLGAGMRWGLGEEVELHTEQPEVGREGGREESPFVEIVTHSIRKAA